MSSISQAVNHFPHFQQLSQPASFTTSANQLQIRSQIQTSTAFSFVTAEGDRVSLSSGSKESTSLDTYTFQGFSQGQAVSFQGQQFSSSSEEHFNLLIEGDLNEQEQADIQEFLTSAKTILQELRDGKAKEATQAAISLGNLETLSQAALFVRQSSSVSVAAQSARVAVQDGPESRDDSRSRSNPGPEREGNLTRFLENIREAQEKFQLDPNRLLERLPKLATRIVDSLKRDTEVEDSPPSLLQQLQKEFLESILQSTRDSQDLQEPKNPQIDTSAQPTIKEQTREQVSPQAIPPQSELTDGQIRQPRIENSATV